MPQEQKVWEKILKRKHTIKMRQKTIIGRKKYGRESSLNKGRHREDLIKGGMREKT